MILFLMYMLISTDANGIRYVPVVSTERVSNEEGNGGKIQDDDEDVPIVPMSRTYAGGGGGASRVVTDEELQARVSQRVQEFLHGKNDHRPGGTKTARRHCKHHNSGTGAPMMMSKEAIEFEKRLNALAATAGPRDGDW